MFSQPMAFLFFFFPYVCKNNIDNDLHWAVCISSLNENSQLTYELKIIILYKKK